jgi:hypothetical protein
MNFQISLGKLSGGNGLALSDTVMAVLFSIMDWSEGYEVTFPSGGHANCVNPDSWANLVFLFPNDVAENPVPGTELLVFPNPAADFIARAIAPVWQTILNVLGEKQWEGYIRYQDRIDISSLRSGVYHMVCGGRRASFIKY